MKTRNSGPTTRDEFKETCYGKCSSKKRDEPARGYEKFTPPCFKSEEEHIAWFRNAINEGIESGFVENFDPEKHLSSLKRRKKINAPKKHSP